MSSRGAKAAVKQLNEAAEVATAKRERAELELPKQTSAVSNNC